MNRLWRFVHSANELGLGSVLKRCLQIRKSFSSNSDFAVFRMCAFVRVPQYKRIGLFNIFERKNVENSQDLIKNKNRCSVTWHCFARQMCGFRFPDFRTFIIFRAWPWHGLSTNISTGRQPTQRMCTATGHFVATKHIFSK